MSENALQLGLVVSVCTMLVCIAGIILHWGVCP